MRRRVPGTDRRARWRLALVATAVMLAQACSLFVPFDEYAGSGTTAARDGQVEDGASDGGALDDADASATCADADIRSDPDNCGACARKCAPGATCAQGRCPVETVLTANAAIRWMTVSVAPGGDAGDGYLYYTTATEDLRRISVTTTTASATPERAPTTEATGYVSVRSAGVTGVLALDAGVAWFRSTTFATAAPQVLAKDRTGLGPVVHEGSNVFWGEPAGVSWRVVNGLGPAQATITTLPSPPPVAFALTTPNRLLWTTSEGATFVTSSDTPGAPAILVDGGVSGTSCLDANSKALFLCQKSQGVLIYDWDQTKGTTRFNAKVTLDDPETIVVSNAYMYIVEYRSTGKADIRRAAVDGRGAAIVLATGLTPSRALAVAGDYVYFSDGSNLLRTTR